MQIYLKLKQCFVNTTSFIRDNKFFFIYFSTLFFLICFGFFFLSSREILLENTEFLKGILKIKESFRDQIQVVFR